MSINLSVQYVFITHFLYSSLGSISQISLGGAMSTATHGSGKNYGIIASYVSKTYKEKHNSKILLKKSDHLVQPFAMGYILKCGWGIEHAKHITL